MAFVKIESEQRPIWLLSDARSGSTWVGSALNYRDQFKEFFEPLHSEFTPELFGEPRIPYFRADEVPRLYQELYFSIFSNRWTSWRSGPKNLNGNSVLVKDIHAMLIASAILMEHPNVLLVCLVRNPIDVAKSKLALDSWEWFREPASLLKNTDLVEDWLHPFVSIIEGAVTQFEKYIVLWAILYYVLFRQLENKAFLLLKYSSSEEFICKVSEVLMHVNARPVHLDQLRTKMLVRSGTDRSRMDCSIGEIAPATPAEVAYATKIANKFGLRNLFEELLAPL